MSSEDECCAVCFVLPKQKVSTQWEQQRLVCWYGVTEAHPVAAMHMHDYGHAAHTAYRQSG